VLTPDNGPPLDFGSVKMGTDSIALSVQIYNTGSADLMVSGLTTTGLDAGDYEILWPSVLGPIFPGGAMTLYLRFHPTSVGIRPATLNVFWNDPYLYSSIALTGNGTF
jgi:hypothetical protein